jgi:hypothetical protein
MTQHAALLDTHIQCPCWCSSDKHDARGINIFISVPNEQENFETCHHCQMCSLWMHSDPLW